MLLLHIQRALTYLYWSIPSRPKNICRKKKIRTSCKLIVSKSPSELLFLRDKYVQRASTVHILNFSKVITNYLLLFYKKIVHILLNELSGRRLSRLLFSFLPPKTRYQVTTEMPVNGIWIYERVYQRMFAKIENFDNAVEFLLLEALFYTL